MTATQTPRKAAAARQGQAFIQSARAFESSEIERVRKNSRIAWKITGFSLLLTGLAVGAVAGLTPLKTVEPFVIRVDNNTGATDIVTTIKKTEQSYGEVIDKYWLAQYVRYREGYDWQTIQDSYDATMLLSAPSIQQQFAKIYQDNPAAPHKVLKDQFRVVTKVKAISFIGHTAQIRFDKIMEPVNSSDTAKVVAPQPMIATIAYEYSAAPQSESDRLINPLGFQVTSYRVDPEVAVQ